MSAADERDVACPTCGAQPGQPCRRVAAPPLSPSYGCGAIDVTHPARIGSMSAPSLAEATAAFADAATAAFNRALSCWWRLSDEDMAAASERFWVAQRDFQTAISAPVEAVS